MNIPLNPKLSNQQVCVLGGDLIVEKAPIPSQLIRVLDATGFSEGLVLAGRARGGN